MREKGGRRGRGEEEENRGRWERERDGEEVQGRWTDEVWLAFGGGNGKWKMALGLAIMGGGRMGWLVTELARWASRREAEVAEENLRRWRIRTEHLSS